MFRRSELRVFDLSASDVRALLTALCGAGRYCRSLVTATCYTVLSPPLTKCHLGSSRPLSAPLGSSRPLSAPLGSTRLLLSADLGSPRLLSAPPLS